MTTDRSSFSETPALPPDARGSESAGLSSDLSAEAQRAKGDPDHPLDVEKAAADPANQFGQYVKLRILGKGGFGTVWLAWDTKLRRRLALKILKGQESDELARFKREATLAAGLSHPNIAAVYEVGQVGPSTGSGQAEHFIALQYIEGDTLAKVRLNPVEALGAIRDAARAVVYAHSKGVIHRDIKPANTMRDLEGWVYVLDFGLAKSLDKESSLSLTGDILGTPAYMSPEQASGNRVEELSDVYSLGATLYELVTGQPPFVGKTALEVVRQVVDQEPIRPRRLNPRLEHDIETIIGKAMEKEPARRYESAAALADDIDRKLAGEPILAHRPSVFYWLRKRIAKRKALAAMGAVAIAAMVSAGVVWEMKRRGDEVAGAELGLSREALLALDQAAQELARYERERMLPVHDMTQARELLARAAEKLQQAAQAQPATHRLWGKLGSVRLMKGDLQEAGEAFDSAIGLAPKVAAYHFKRGQIYWRMSEQAEQSAHASVQEGSSPDLREARRLRSLAFQAMRRACDGRGWDETWQADYAQAVLLTREGGAEDARRLCREMDRNYPQRLEILLLAARVEKTLGDYERAENLASRAIDVARSEVDAYTIRASARYQLKHWKSAIADYSEAIRLDPKHALGYYNRGHVKEDLGDHQGAIADYSEAIRLDPNDANAYTNRGFAKSKLGDHEGAITDYSEAIRLDPKHALAYTNRGVVKEDLGDHQGAIADFTAAVRLDPEFAWAYTNRGASKKGLGDQLAKNKRLEEARRQWQGAIADHSEAIRLDPKHALAYTNRAAVKEDLGDHQGAIADCTEAIRLDPNDALAYYNRGHVKVTLGDHQGAIADYTEAIRLDPKYAKSYSNRGVAKNHLGDQLAKSKRLEEARRQWRGAIADYSEAIRLDPKHVLAYTNRGQTKVVLGIHLTMRHRHEEARVEWKDAIADCTEAIRLNRKDPDTHFIRGLAKEVLGDLQGAISDYKKALEVALEDWPQRGNAEEQLRGAREALKAETDY